MHGEIINYEAEFAWGKKDANGRNFESPNIRRDLKSFSGPVLYDVAKTMHVAHNSVENNLQLSQEGSLSPIVQGKRRKRQIGGDLKDVANETQIGSGLAEAVEQPCRPQ